MNIKNNLHDKEFSRRQQFLLGSLFGMALINFTGLLFWEKQEFSWLGAGLIILLTVCATVISVFVSSILFSKSTKSYFYSPQAGDKMRSFGSVHVNGGGQNYFINLVYLDHLSRFSFCHSEPIGLGIDQGYILNSSGKTYKPLLSSMQPSFNGLCGNSVDVWRSWVRPGRVFFSASLLMNLSIVINSIYFLGFSSFSASCLAAGLWFVEFLFWRFCGDVIMDSKSHFYCRNQVETERRFVVLASMKCVEREDGQDEHVFLYRYLYSSVVYLDFSVGKGLKANKRYVLKTDGHFKQINRSKSNSSVVGRKKPETKPAEAESIDSIDEEEGRRLILQPIKIRKMSKEELINALIKCSRIEKAERLLARLIDLDETGFHDFYEISMSAHFKEVAFMAGERTYSYLGRGNISFEKEFIELAQFSRSSRVRTFLQKKLLYRLQTRDLLLDKCAVEGETSEIRSFAQKKLLGENVDFNSELFDYLAAHAETEELRSAFLEKMILQMNEKDPV